MLSNNAMLVSLTISQWTARRLDKIATNTVEEKHGNASRTGNYTKKLLPGSRELDAVASTASAMRAFYYAQTLPWSNEGMRILAAKNYLPFNKEFKRYKDAFEDAVKTFAAAYNILKVDAQNKLGDLFREAEYPHESAILTKFGVAVDFFPMPDVGDFRVSIQDADKEVFVQRMKDVEATAMKECWTRLYEVVSKAASRLSQPDAVFRDSLIENILDVCTLLPRLNIQDDPALEKARSEVEGIVAGISADVCRSSTSERNNAARSLQDAISRMSSIMGGTP